MLRALCVWVFTTIALIPTWRQSRPRPREVECCAPGHTAAWAQAGGGTSGVREPEGRTTVPLLPVSSLRPRSWQVSSPSRHSQGVSVLTPSGLPLLPHWAPGALSLESSRAWER